jgi:hypothetical protein
LKPIGQRLKFSAITNVAINNAQALLWIQERLNQVLMEKKKESKNGIEIMNLLQVLYNTFPKIVKLEIGDRVACSFVCYDLLL